MSRVPSLIVSISLLCALSLAASDRSAGASGDARPQRAAAWKAQTYVQGPPDNALKGFIPYIGAYSTFPYSMEWFYVPWKDIQSDYDTYTWGALDAQLKKAADRGHQSVFRVYADYPGQPYGLPSFLSSVARLAYTDYNNTASYSPDYENANLRRAMKNVIAALGARYDGDARIGFMEVGFLGFWGEWHTYPHTAWFASAAVQNEVLDAFEGAFHSTKLLMREPKAGTHPATRAIGYHDDSFAYATYGSTAWYFWPIITAAGVDRKWRTFPIGGELRPEIQLATWQDASLCQSGDTGGERQCYNVCVDTTHASWLMAQNVFSPGNTNVEHARALQGAARLGYDLFVSSVALAETVSAYAIGVSITMTNKGVAPFYYDWPVRLSIADASNTIVASWDTPWKLTEAVDAGADVTYSYSGRAAGLRLGTYKLLMAAVNPLPNGKPLVFANKAWGQDVAGTLTLGTFAITEPTGVPGPDAAAVPGDCLLRQNYPNPFNPTTTITFTLAERSFVALKIFDLLGKELATLAAEEMRPGSHSRDWNAGALPSGVYLYRLQAGPSVQTRKIVLLR